MHQSPCRKCQEGPVFCGEKCLKIDGYQEKAMRDPADPRQAVDTTDDGYSVGRP